MIDVPLQSIQELGEEIDRHGDRVQYSVCRSASCNQSLQDTFTRTKRIITR